MAEAPVFVCAAAAVFAGAAAFAVVAVFARVVRAHRRRGLARSGRVVAVVVVGEAGAAPVEVGAPSLALAAPEIFTAWCALLIADW